VAEQVGVASESDSLERDGDDEQRPVGVRDEPEGPLGADELREEEVEDDDDGKEEDGPAQCLDERSLLLRRWSFGAPRIS